MPRPRLNKLRLQVMLTRTTVTRLDALALTLGQDRSVTIEQLVKEALHRRRKRSYGPRPAGPDLATAPPAAAPPTPSVCADGVTEGAHDGQS